MDQMERVFSLSISRDVLTDLSTDLRKEVARFRITVLWVVRKSNILSFLWQ